MSSELRTVARHSGIYGFASLLNRGAAFLLIPLYTRAFDPAEYGVLGLINVASEIIGTVLGLGLGLAMTRIYFDYKDERERSEVVSTTVLFFGAVAAAFLAVFWFNAEALSRLVLKQPGHGELMFLGATGLLLNSLLTIGLQSLRVRQRSVSFLLASTLRSVLYLGLNAWFVVGLEWGVRGALLGILTANAIAGAVLLIPILVRAGMRFSRTKLKAMLRFGLPVLPGSLAEFSIAFVDRYLLAHFASLTAVGVYFLGFRLGTLLYALLIVPFGQIYVTRRLEAFGGRADDPEAGRVFTYFFAVMVAAALALALLAPEIIALGAAAEYAEAATVVPLLALSQVIHSVLLIAQMGIFYSKQGRRLLMASLVMLAVHVPLCWLLVERFGAAGAAAAACAAALAKLIATQRLSRGLPGPQPEWNRLAAILGIGLGAYALGMATLDMTAPFGLVTRLALCAAFPVSILVLPLFTPEERSTFVSLANSIRKRLLPSWRS